uniref:Uncharacterized protein n=1 Tax=Timema tahoe TaxID=61484 RepID=A0A7R9IIA4_9NEOP|nr:unnamed protein product [Timema tahoe]
MSKVKLYRGAIHSSGDIARGTFRKEIEDSKSVAMMKHGLKLMKSKTEYLNVGQPPVITMEQPLYALAKTKSSLMIQLKCQIKVLKRCSFKMKVLIMILNRFLKITLYQKGKIYKNFTDEVTVHIGPQNAERYFTMDRFHGRDRFGFWDQFSCDTVKGATEGISYHQNIKKNDTLLYFRKTICRVATVYYVGFGQTDKRASERAHKRLGGQTGEHASERSLARSPSLAAPLPGSPPFSSQCNKCDDS